GLFRKDKKALNEWSESNVMLCSLRQKRILADVWPSLKENGFLIYATCSYSPKEDEMILDWLSENYSVACVDLPVPEEWGIVRSVSENNFAGYRFFPDKLQGEGFFIAVLQKKKTTKVISYSKFR